jgi:hypothetical protein
MLCKAWSYHSKHIHCMALARSDISMVGSKSKFWRPSPCCQVQTQYWEHFTSTKHWFLAHQWQDRQPRSKSVIKNTSSTALIYPSDWPLQLLWKWFTNILCDFKRSGSDIKEYSPYFCLLSYKWHENTVIEQAKSVEKKWGKPVLWNQLDLLTSMPWIP